MLTDTRAPRKLFVFGLGYTGEYVARRMLAAGWSVAGTTQSAEKSRRLRSLGIEARIFAPTAGPAQSRDREGAQAELAAALSDTTHLLSAIPPDEWGDPVLRNEAAAIGTLGALRWVGYLSTTGVYGNADGGWVNEDSPLNPSNERARRRVEAEAAWRESARNRKIPLRIFRLAAIYGPGRSAIDAVRAGTARRIVKSGQIFSRIHVEDIAQILEASMMRAAAAPGVPAPVDPARVYNLCDDDPAPPQDVIAYAAELLGVVPPPEIPFEKAELSPMARSFYLDNKRVDNRRIKAEMAVALRYPSYRDGLKAQLAADAKAAS